MTVHDHKWLCVHAALAETHPRYAEAVAIAEMGDNAQPFDPVWIRTRGDVDAVLEGCYFNAFDAEDYAGFFVDYLHFVKGEKAPGPFGLDPWQKYDVVMPIFGWQRRDGLRRFRQAFIWIPKKNGKSTMCAGFGTLMLTFDGERGPRVISAASTRDQARLVHDDATEMVLGSPRLANRLLVRRAEKSIIDRKHNGVYKAISSDAGAQEGHDWSCLIFDELHAQNNRDFWEALVYGGIAREQPLLIAISTAGEYDPNSIAWEEWDISRKTLAGELTNSERFGYIRCAEEGDDLEDPAIWYKANPGLGLNLRESDLARQVQTASESPAKWADLERRRFNRWVQAVNSWLMPGLWQACETDFGPEELKGEKCWGGLDLSSVNDLTAFVLWFPPAAGRKARLLEWFWLPMDRLVELQKQHNAPYSQWLKDGWLRGTPGACVDYETLAADVIAICDDYKVQDIGYDKHAATAPVTILDNSGLTVIEQPQSMLAMSPATKSLERHITSREVEHRGHPTMAWMVSNCQALVDANGNVKLLKADRRRKVRYKIDGPVAAVMALDRAERNAKKPSVYERRGVLTVGGG